MPTIKHTYVFIFRTQRRETALCIQIASFSEHAAMRFAFFILRFSNRLCFPEHRHIWEILLPFYIKIRIEPPYNAIIVSHTGQ